MNQPVFDTVAVFQALPGNHLILLPDAPRFTIVGVTDAYLAVTYTDRDDILGKGVFDVFTEDVTNPQAGIVATQLSTSLLYVVRYRQIHAMTHQRYDVINPRTGSLEYKVWKPLNQPVLDEDGTLRYIIHSVEDITPAVQLGEITQANQYLQTIINLFKEPLQVLQPVFENGQIVDFRFILTNQAYAAYANATPEQLQGKRVGEVFPGYFDTVSFTNPVQTYLTGQPLTFDIHYDQDGLDLYNRMSTGKLNEEVVIHFTDFTQLKQLQLQLERNVEELKRSNDNLQQFAYVASHDLQEPLRKIQSFGNLLEANYAERLGEGVAHLYRMQSAASRMSTLIKDLLHYAQLTTSERPRRTVDLSMLIHRVLTDLDLVLEQTGAVVQVANLPTLPGDELQLGQLFQNLLSNALKFRRPGEAPLIQIRADQVAADALPTDVVHRPAAARYHRIEVSDNGIGFEQKYVDRIFQVFQRLHGKGHYEGTGIGLAICQKVATNHGGIITAQSRPGQGTTFTVYLSTV